jgi:hypothetical protein
MGVVLFLLLAIIVYVKTFEKDFEQEDLSGSTLIVAVVMLILVLSMFFSA